MMTEKQSPYTPDAGLSYVEERIAAHALKEAMLDQEYKRMAAERISDALEDAGVFVPVELHQFLVCEDGEVRLNIPGCGPIMVHGPDRYAAYPCGLLPYGNGQPTWEYSQGQLRLTGLDEALFRARNYRKKYDEAEARLLERITTTQETDLPMDYLQNAQEILSNGDPTYVCAVALIAIANILKRSLK